VNAAAADITVTVVCPLKDDDDAGGEFDSRFARF
jgi:hypothetical protein